ncbi:hypothetical protein ACFFMR_03915, partial [Micromonospora andamanensis]
MSNYLRKNDAVAGTSTRRSRRKALLASGVAGLVSLGGVGVATSAGAAGLTDLKWSTAEQVTRDDAVQPDTAGPDARDDRHGKGKRPSEDARGKDNEHGGRAEDGYGRAKEVPCDPAAL